MTKARHWTAKDAGEVVVDIWPGRDGDMAVHAPRAMCDNGGLLLTLRERSMLDRAIATARASKDMSGYIYEGDLCMGVNLRQTGNHGMHPPRWVLSKGDRHVAGGFVDASPQIERQRIIHEVRLPDRRAS